MAAGLPPVPMVLDTYYRETLGDSYTEPVEDRSIPVRDRNNQGWGQGRGRGGGQRGRNPVGPAGGTQVAADQVGRLPVILTDARMANGEKICLKYNRQNCNRYKILFD